MTTKIDNGTKSVPSIWDIIMMECIFLNQVKKFINQKEHKNSRNWTEEVWYPTPPFWNSYSCWGADQKSRDWSDTATHMMKNKNNKVELRLIWVYGCLYYYLLPRSILGGFVIQCLWGSLWWTFKSCEFWTKSQNIFCLVWTQQFIIKN